MIFIVYAIVNQLKQAQQGINLLHRVNNSSLIDFINCKFIVTMHFMCILNIVVCSPNIFSDRTINQFITQNK
jgi:hypothetical protein